MRRREWRASARWRMVGKAVFVLVVVAAIVHSAAVVVLGRRVEARLAALRAAGQPVSVTELAGPPVPDDQNAATVYRGIFRTLPTTGGQFPSQPSGSSAPRPAILDWAPEPSAQAQEDARVLGHYLDPERRAQEAGLHERARRAVARYAEIPRLTAQAVARPQCRFPVNWEDGAGALVPHLLRIGSLARFLAAKAVLDARDGRMAEAAQAVTLTFQVSESLRDDPSLIGQLVRMAALQVGATALREVSEWGDIPEEDARRLADTLARIDPGPGFVEAMAVERAMGISVFGRVGRRSSAGPPSPANGASNISRVASAYPWWHLVARPLLYADQLAYLDLMGRQVAAAEERSARAAQAQLAAAEQAARSLPWFAILSHVGSVAFTSYGRARLGLDRAHAALAGSRALLGLVVYRQRFGAYPESLAALRQRLNWEVPDDPFSEKPLVYRRQGSGFLLYSVGPDMKDDGGRPTRELRERIGAGVLLRDRRTGATTPAPEAMDRPAAPGGAPTKDAGAGDLVWQRGH
ncbi:MAG: hypothetical protein HY321_17365 [Armatimonadetes bacterium]|nr:hypothetical protein [Armatimonadota bacterium]